MTKESQLTSVLYDGHSIPEILDLYIQRLKKSNDIDDISHANKLIEYRKLITNKKFLSKIRKNFNSIYSTITSEYPNLRFNIEGRRKSLLSVEKKILRLQSEKRSLEYLRDLMAFRIIIFDNSEELCYDLMEKIIEFNAKRGFILCEADSKTMSLKIVLQKAHHFLQNTNMV